MIQSVADGCTGCTACFSICPVPCIVMKEDAYGFIRPLVDEERCIQCGKCRTVCPALEFPRAQTIHQSVCGWHRNGEIREASSSGGAFASLATVVLDRGGIVFGATFDPDTQTVQHRSSDDVSLDDLQRSKYVQSDLSDSFVRIQAELRSGRDVLFAGTPCQVNGLNRFLGASEHAKLTTCDFSCHGVPSRAVFSAYIHQLESLRGSRVTAVNFRSKIKGWKQSTIRIDFANGSRFETLNEATPYYRGFLENYYLAPCCYSCQHNANHSADVILADFWGWRKLDERLADDDRGLSLVLSNSDKGDSLINAIEPSFLMREVPLDCSRYCLGTSGVTREKYRDRFHQFFKVFHTAGYDVASRRYLSPSQTTKMIRRIKRVWARGLVSWLGEKLRAKRGCR